MSDMGRPRWKEGVNRFEHFMAYKNAIMCDDERCDESSAAPSSSGAMSTVHAENGELVYQLQQRASEKGHLGPEGHPLVAPADAEGEAANRAIASPTCSACPSISCM